MATEIITRTLCDVHLSRDDDTKEDGKPRAVAIDGEAFVIDVCPSCAEPIESLLAYLREHGRKEGKAAKPLVTGGALETCPAEGCTVSGTKAQLRAHARQKHGATLVDLRGETTAFKCHHADCQQHFEGQQGLAVHVTRAHAGVWAEPPSEAGGRAPRKGSGGKAA